MKLCARWAAVMVDVIFQFPRQSLRPCGLLAILNFLWIVGALLQEHVTSITSAAIASGTNAIFMPCRCVDWTGALQYAPAPPEAVEAYKAG